MPGPGTFKGRQGGRGSRPKPVRKLSIAEELAKQAGMAGSGFSITLDPDKISRVVGEAIAEDWRDALRRGHQIGGERLPALEPETTDPSAGGASKRRGKTAPRGYVTGEFAQSIRVHAGRQADWVGSDQFAQAAAIFEGVKPVADPSSLRVRAALQSLVDEMVNVKKAP